MNTISIYRDSFSRCDIVRATVPKHERDDCAFCGQPARFRYGVDPDAGRTYVAPQQFCSVGCARSYGLLEERR